MRSLGRLVRGLSALFWGLPLAFLVCFYTARADLLKSFGITPPLACTGLLVYGLWQLGGFQKQERVWRNALDWARILALADFMLSPFLYWWNREPSIPFFTAMVVLLSISSLLFLASLNLVIQRLGAMLPDEGLRLEIRQFTAMNLNLLLVILILAVAYLAALSAGAFSLQLPPWLDDITAIVQRTGILCVTALAMLVLLPMAMTMALLWKTKEVILEGVFSSK
jgi:hypothetical protein